MNHTLLALSKSRTNFDIRLVLLLHDIGKPFSYQDGEVRHFKNHPVVSANMSKHILSRLGYESAFINEVCKLILKHDIPITDDDIELNKEFCLKLYEIQYCDAMAHNPEKLEKRIKYLENIST